MRINFTGRRKIDKAHALVSIQDDPVGSASGFYFEVKLELSNYDLPLDARVFIEAFRALTLVRFDLGAVGQLAELTPAQRRLSEFGQGNPDGVRFRVKVTQPDGPDAGKLLAEADNLRPITGGASPLIYLAGEDLGQTPFRLELVPTDSALPTLYINNSLGGKEYAKHAVAKPLLLTAAVREVFTALVWAGDHEEDEEHWTSLWRRFATQSLGLDDPPDAEEEDEVFVTEWIERAVNAFATRQELVSGLGQQMAAMELAELEEMSQ